MASRLFWCSRLGLGALLALLLAAILSAEALPSLVKMLFTKNAKLLRRSCERLAGIGFSRGKVQQDLAASFGGFHLAIKAMKAHDEPGLQAACGSALGSMALFNYNNAAYGARLGALEQLLGAMRNYPDVAYVQHLASSVGCFTDWIPANRAEVGRLGGIELNMAAIRNHYWDGAVQFHAYCLFSNNLLDADNAARMVNDGGINLTLSVMRDHPKSPRVVEECLQALRGLAEHSQFRDQLIEGGAVEASLTGMREAPHDAHVQSAGAGFMSKLSRGGTRYQDAIGKAGGIEVLAATMREGAKMMGVGADNYGGLATESVWPFLMDACEALAVLAQKNDGHRESMVHFGVIEDVSRAMRGKLHDGGIQTQCCSVLALLVLGNTTRLSRATAAGAPACRTTSGQALAW